MAKFSVTADVILTFELEGAQPEAQAFIFDSFDDTSAVDRFNAGAIRVTMWVEPASNEPRTYEHDGMKCHRFTVSMSMTFAIEGGYADAQAWVLDRLQPKNGVHNMVVQSVNLLCTPLIDGH